MVMDLDQASNSFHEALRPLALLPMRGCEEMGDMVNDYLSRWTTDPEVDQLLTFPGYNKSSFLIRAECPRFGTGEAKGILHETGDDEYEIRNLQDGKMKGVLLKREYLMDILVENVADNVMRIKQPILICESEMSSQYGKCRLDENADDYDPSENGYIWDFEKLFYVSGKRRLFTCRAAYSNHTHIKKALNDWSRTFTKFWQDGDLIVVILPTSMRDRPSIGLGVTNGKRTGSLDFWECEL